MGWKHLKVFMAAPIIPLLTSCAHVSATTSGCGYPAEITIGNSTKNTPTGSCAGYFTPAAVASVHMSMGQTLTVHFGESGAAFATSLHPKVLELAAKNAMDQSFQAVAPGVSEILYSPPGGGLVCTNGQTMAVPCLIAKVTVAESCVGKSTKKCNSSQNQGTATAKGLTPQESPSIAALEAEQSPLAVMCKHGFFTKTQAQLLAQQFGLIECFRFSGENKWVIIGNGYPQQSNSTSPGPTRGGAIVATEKCVSKDRACLDPSSVHDFANFTVYYRPDPLMNVPAVLYTTSHGNLLSISGVKGCTPMTFDITNGHWYPKSASDHLLETNPGSIQSLKVPAPVNGATALAQKAPFATISTISTLSAC